MQLDKWQEDVLNTTGNIVLRSGRQVGKSTVIAVKAAEYAVQNARKSIMIISATERQAYLLFSKVLMYIHDHGKEYLKKGKDRPTKSEIKLKNGSVIRCLPTGLDGLGIRGYTVDLLIADEAAFIPQDVWPAITPMLATTGGTIILLSTPFGRAGYFYDCFQDETYTKFHINAEEVALAREEPQKSNMREHQEREKKRMTKLQYAQEYLGEFVDELRQFFTDEIIKRVCMLRRNGFVTGDYYCGIDVARMGEDESTFEILRRIDREHYEQVESIITTKTLTTDTAKKVLELEKIYKFKRIYIDDGGVGVGVFDQLMLEDATRLKIEAVNNARRALSNKEENKQYKKILKEDLYNNLLRMMEQGHIKLLDDDEIAASLKSVQYEYLMKDETPTRLRIFGNYTHIAEGLIRAAWCAQTKHLNLWVRYT